MSEIKLYTPQPGWSLKEHEIEFMTFPGGEEHVKGHLSEPSGTTFIIDARISDSSGILRTLLLTDFIRHKVRRARIHLFCPYLPGARQDRGAPLTAAVYADLINSADFESVTSVDPHSDVMPALIRNEFHLPITEVFPYEGAFPGPARAVLVIPDAGAVKRVQAVADKWGYQTVQALKTRDPNTGKLTDFKCDPIPPAAHAIIVDDICDGGGTFLGLAETINAQWASAKYGEPKLHLWTTHGIYSKGLNDLAKAFTTIASTDSFPIREFAKIAGKESKVDLPLTRVPLSGTLQALADKKEFM